MSCAHDGGDAGQRGRSVALQEKSPKNPVKVRGGPRGTEATDQAQGAQRGAVAHRDHVRPMRNLVGRGVGIAVHRDDLNTQALQLDSDFLAQFAGAKEEEAGGAWGEGSADGGHWW